MNENREYVKLVTQFYLDTDFDPTMNYTFIMRGRSFGGYAKGAYPKGVINDFDGVFNADRTPHLMSLFLDELSFSNMGIRYFRDRIEDLIEDIIDNYKKGRNYFQAVKRFADNLKEARLEREEYEEASERAAKKLELTPNTLSYISDLTGLGYLVSINSASPQRALEVLAEERLNIPAAHVYGTRYIFRERLVDEVQSQLGFEKERAKNSFLRGIKCTTDFSVIVDDDPEMDGILGTKAGLGLVAWIGDRGLSFDSLPGEIKVYCPEARMDIRALVPYIQKYEKARVQAFLKDPIAELAVIEEAQRFEDIANRCVRSDGTDFLRNLTEFSQTYHKLLGILDPTFPVFSSEVNEIFSKLGSSNDTETRKKLIVDIVDRVREYTPELRHGKDRLQTFIEELDRLIV